MVHSVTPPPELLSKWEDEILKRYENVDVQLLNAYQAGADAELEACCGWIESKSELGVLSFVPEVRAKFRCQVSDQLRAARRPKPPSLKQQASEALDQVVECLKMLVPGASVDGVHIETIRRALESLPDPQD